MGRVSGCTPLLTWKGPNKPETGQKKSHTMAWDGTLSLFQQKASDRLLATIDAFVHGVTERDEFLIWAVCGSGKTEMLFQGLKHALNQGLKVAIATPRTDVVLELEPRLMEAFPNTVIHAFYGGAKDRFAQAELIIITTHQLLRYYHCFDLVFIDEVDAFPFSADKKLTYAVSQAKKERSLTVYVTATPVDSMQRKAEKGELNCAKVARRYHQHPLPEPRYQWIGQWKKKLRQGKVPPKVLAWLRAHLANQKQVFLFVPSVDVMKRLKETITPLLDVSVDAVHSADEERREKVMNFRNGETRVLITTTILERGVTVKGVQVGVFGAEDRIFTESALVQIAGRAGRKPAEPTGDVVYFHFGKTEEMVKAIRHIRKMNQLGEVELLQEKAQKQLDMSGEW
ncbi:MAG: DEAD/DEAH box helicase family protein [Bacillus sp. (in: Bacteria)]|nr:DEAD/DEAH box helicase family protein [Bacillus sp. (in: firmicutes)]